MTVMPVLVQWKWQEDTNTFLVIFHFDDDFSKPNLRTRRMTFRDTGHSVYEYTPEDIIMRLGNRANLAEQKTRTVVTWSPSHPEAALLSEVLSYANIINGLSDWKKKRLLKTEAIFSDFSDLKNLSKIAVEFIKSLGDKTFAIGVDAVNVENKTASYLFCAELCPEYIEYLKRIRVKYTK